MTYDYMKPRLADISRYQYLWDDDWNIIQGVDFNKMKAAGIEGVVIRCTVGNYYHDRAFVTSWKQAGDAGLLRSAYHVVTPEYSAESQIAWFTAHFNNREPDLPIVLDCELTRDQTPERITNVIKKCADFLENYGFEVMIYTRATWWDPNVQRRAYWQDYDLWVAHYNENVNEPDLPFDWLDWQIWQYTSKGDGEEHGVASKSIDLNRVHYEDYLPDDDDNDNGNGGTIEVTNIEQLKEAVEYLEGKGAPYSVMVEYKIWAEPSDFDDYEPPEPPEEPGNGEEPPVEPPLPDGEVMYAAADDRDDILALQEVGRNDKGKMIMGFYPDGEPADQRIRVPNGDAVYVNPDNITVDGGSANDVREWLDKPDNVQIKLYFWKRWLSKTKPE